MSIDSISSLGTGFLPDFGVDNFVIASSPIPELGTWSLLLIGFAGVALRLRSRRSSTALDPA